MDATARYVEAARASILSPPTDARPGSAAFSGLVGRPGEGVEPTRALSQLQALDEREAPLVVARWAAVSGMLVEAGADAGVAVEVPPRIRRLLRAAARLVDEGKTVAEIAKALRDVHPEHVAALEVAELLVPPAMTLLVRDRPARIAARRDTAFHSAAHALRSLVPSARYLADYLAGVDGFPFEIIHARRGVGFELRADDVQNCFQLFALIEGALSEDARAEALHEARPVPDLYDLARGGRAAIDQTEARCAWGFYNFSAWTPKGLDEDRAARLIWGELPLTSIPPIEGRPVIVIGPSRIDRSWAPTLVAPLHPLHRPQITVVRPMDKTEVRRRLALFAGAPPPLRERLRYATLEFISRESF